MTPVDPEEAQEILLPPLVILVVPAVGGDDECARGAEGEISQNPEAAIIPPDPAALIKKKADDDPCEAMIYLSPEIPFGRSVGPKGGRPSALKEWAVKASRSRTLRPLAADDDHRMRVIFLLLERGA